MLISTLLSSRFSLEPKKHINLYFICKLVYSLFQPAPSLLFFRCPAPLSRLISALFSFSLLSSAMSSSVLLCSSLFCCALFLSVLFCSSLFCSALPGPLLCLASVLAPPSRFHPPFHQRKRLYSQRLKRISIHRLKFEVYFHISI